MSKLRTRFAEWLFNRLYSRFAFQKPDLVIGSDKDDAYMNRWWVIPRNRFVVNVYFHEIRRSDDDRALHDHPWANLSFLLRGSYVEHTISAGGIHHRVTRKAGDLKVRTAAAAHRLEIGAEPCWSLFICGPFQRKWGFHCAEKGWVPFDEFLDKQAMAEGRSVRGKGCGE